MLFFAFLLFSTIGLLLTTGSPHHVPSLLFLALVLTYGVFAVFYAYVSVRLHWAGVFALMPIEFLVIAWLQSRLVLQPTAPYSELADRLGWSLGIACLLIAVSYTLVFIVLKREGKRYFKMHAEVELASEIHRVLVPPIHLRIGDYQIHGLSLPSGEVGGDLVDTFLRPHQSGWIAYVADVSGHGVASGVLMAMLKSAMHTSLRQNQDAPTMLNQVFYSLKAPNAFATFAAVSFTPSAGLQIIVAGHLPILHGDGQKVRELDTPGLPLGILPESEFCAMAVELNPGGTLAIVTDGMTEIFSRNGAELGERYIKDMPVKDHNRSLDQIANALLAQSDAWGPRSDDQSLLLIRRVE